MAGFSSRTYGPSPQRFGHSQSRDPGRPQQPRVKRGAPDSHGEAAGAVPIGFPAQSLGSAAARGFQAENQDASPSPQQRPGAPWASQREWQSDSCDRPERERTNRDPGGRSSLGGADLFRGARGRGSELQLPKAGRGGGSAEGQQGVSRPTGGALALARTEGLGEGLQDGDAAEADPAQPQPPAQGAATQEPQTQGEQRQPAPAAARSGPSTAGFGAPPLSASRRPLRSRRLRPPGRDEIFPPPLSAWPQAACDQEGGVQLASLALTEEEEAGWMELLAVAAEEGGDGAGGVLGDEGLGGSGEGALVGLNEELRRPLQARRDGSPSLWAVAPAVKREGGAPPPMSGAADARQAPPSASLGARTDRSGILSHAVGVGGGYFFGPSSAQLLRPLALARAAQRPVSLAQLLGLGAAHTAPAATEQVGKGAAGPARTGLKQ
jgi:hypothetical protein